MCSFLDVPDVQHLEVLFVLSERVVEKLARQATVSNIYQSITVEPSIIYSEVCFFSLNESKVWLSLIHFLHECYFFGRERQIEWNVVVKRFVCALGGSIASVFWLLWAHSVLVKSVLFSCWDRLWQVIRCQESVMPRGSTVL